MDKRTLLALVLSMGIMLGFYYLNPPKKETPKKEVAASETKQQTTQEVAQAPKAQLQPAIRPTSAAEKDIKVETDLFIATFSSKGGSIKSFALKKYNELASSNNNVILENESDPKILQFSTKVQGTDITTTTNFNTTSKDSTITGDKKEEIKFSYVSNSGLQINKTYTLSGNSYSIALKTEVINLSKNPISTNVEALLSYPETKDKKSPENRYENAGSFLLSKDSLEVNKISDVEKPKKFENVKWAAVADKYFITAILSDNGSMDSTELSKNSDGFLQVNTKSKQLDLLANGSTTIQNNIFIGPKDIDILKAQGSDFEKSLDLGWFSVIAKPLLYALKFLYGYVENYGFAIIILTVFIKILFFPLTHKSYKSMKDLQKLQPLMAEIKEKYKNDKEAMNREMMEFYRTNKVNPLGGCLPILVQMPVFLALYQVLMFHSFAFHVILMMLLTLKFYELHPVIFLQ